MTKSLAVLASELTATYADDRQVILLDGILSSRTFTFAGDTLTTPTAHDLVVDSRVVFSTTGALPSPLVAGTEYFVITIPLTTTLTISETLGGSAITLSGGSGTHTITEQFLSAEDSIAVLVNHEISHPDYTRSTFTAGTCVASPADNDARSPNQFRVITVGSSNPTLEYQYILLVRNGSLTIGNTTGDRHQLETEPALQAIAPNTPKQILLRVRRSN